MSSMPPADDCPLFTPADLVHGYSRAEAIADGFLVALPADTCREAGIRLPVACTRAVFERYIDLTPAARQACNDVSGRLWDVLWMFRCAAARQAGASAILYELRCVTTRVRPSRVVLKAVVRPDDDGSPCITIMLPNED